MKASTPKKEPPRFVYEVYISGPSGEQTLQIYWERSQAQRYAIRYGAKLKKWTVSK